MVAKIIHVAIAYIHRIHTTHTKSPAAAGLEISQDPEHVRVVEVDHGVATQDQVEWFLDLVCYQVVLLGQYTKNEADM